MILELLHRPEGKPQRLPELSEPRAGYNVGSANQTNTAGMPPHQWPSTPAEGHACERCSDGRIPPIPKVEKTADEHPPLSFDALASDLDDKFAGLAADIGKMRKELRDAEERSEQLRRRVLNGKLRLWA